MTELTKLTIAKALKGLKDKEFTAVELTNAYIKEQQNGRKYNTYVLETPEIA